MAAGSPGIDLRAVTCVAGNTTLDNVQRNARAILTVAGRHDVPVAAGLARPLLRELVTAPSIHGDTGFGGASAPTPEIELDPRHAVDLLVESIMAAEEPITLVPIGPLSNIAMAMRREPGIRERVDRVIIMGGAIAQGNHTPSAEFNIYVDPEAADIVFGSGLPLTMVGLDVTRQALVGPEEVRRIRALGNRSSVLVADMLEFYTQSHLARRGLPSAPLHDPCCIAEVIDPGLIATQPMNVQIETISPLTRGRTVCDVRGTTGLPTNAEVGVSIDRERFVEIMMACLSTLP